MPLYLRAKSPLVAKQTRFLGEFFKQRKVVGAVAPSSRFLMRKMLSGVNFKEAKVIVELGPGNGVFTKGMLKQMREDALLFSFELNEQFHAQVENKVKDSRLNLINDSAEHVGKYLKEHGIEQVDYVVSSLPLAVIPNEIKHKILDECVSCLKADGLYIQFQYSLNAKKLLEEKFGKIKLDFSPINVPPAFVYKCSLKEPIS